MTIKVTVHKNRFNLDNMRDGIVRIGWFQQNRYDDNTPVAAVARWNEFGTGNIPSRPFMRPVLHSQKQTILENLRHQYQMAIRNNQNTTKVLHLIGEDVRWRIQSQILATTTPPNAPSTIKAKGFNKPLYDTGFMLNSVNYQVEELFR